MNLAIPPEPMDIKIEVKRAREEEETAGRFWKLDFLIIYCTLPKHLWDYWYLDLEIEKFKYNDLQKILSSHYDNIDLWINDEMTWEKLIETIKGTIEKIFKINLVIPPEPMDIKRRIQKEDNVIKKKHIAFTSIASYLYGYWKDSLRRKGIDWRKKFRKIISYHHRSGRGILQWSEEKIAWKKLIENIKGQIEEGREPYEMYFLKNICKNK